MRYVVTAGYVTVETELPGGGRAQVDVRRGEMLPADVPQAQIDHELRLRTIELAAEPKQPASPSGDGDAGDIPPVDPDALPPGMSVATTQDWVGASKARARIALAAEQAHPTPRTTLVARLQAVLDSE